MQVLRHSSATRPMMAAIFATVSVVSAAQAQSIPVSPVALIAAHSNKCADIEGASKANGARLIQWDCHGGPNQQWRVTAVNGAYEVISVNSGQCLDAWGWGRNNGTAVVQWPCHGGANQLWRVEPFNGKWRLVNVNANRCLDVSGISTANLAAYHIWDCWGGGNQTFAMSAQGAPAPAPAPGPAPKPTPGTPSAQSTMGQWGQKITLPIVPISAVTLPSGKVMLWSASGPKSFGGGGATYTAVFDPQSNGIQSYVTNNVGQEFFCEGTAQLPDGRTIISGGVNAQMSSFIDANGGAAKGPTFNIARGYNGMTTTSKGEVFTIGGSWSGGVGGKNGELYSGGAWKLMPGVPVAGFSTNDPNASRADNHMWLVGADNGYVLHAGPSTRMHWVDTAGNGAVRDAGLRGNADAMNGIVAVYDVDKVLTAGGAPTYDNATPTANAHVIDLSAGAGAPPAVRGISSMTSPRTFANAVVLPTGQVVINGGESAPGANPFNDAASVLNVDIFSPATNSFTRGAAMSTPRNYHSIAVLLTDGRVLAAGGGACDTCATNHPDLEVFSPPYLFNADGSAAARPNLSAAPASAARGDRITVTATGASQYALVRMGGVTHSVNNDQRRVPLQVVSTSGTQVTLQVPARSGVAIPGNYMLFAMSASGTPSIAKIINIR